MSQNPLHRPRGIALHAGPLALLLAALLLPNASWAATRASDSRGPTRIQSEQLEHDEQRQVTRFSGKVSLAREGLVLTGDRLELRQRPDGTSTALLFGSPARFSQEAKPGYGQVSGRSDRMEFDTQTEVLVLSGEAQLRRTEDERLLDEVVGDRITYRSAAQTYEVDTQPGQGRAQMTLMPRKANSPEKTPAR